MVDPDFKLDRRQTGLRATQGPVVAIDQAHRNFHAMDGQYAPFAALLTADGYRVRANTAPITAAALAGVDVLVIANARGAAPGADAFSGAEADALHAWVSAGRSLLLIADHAPFGPAAPVARGAVRRRHGQGLCLVVGPPGRAADRIADRIQPARRSAAHPIIAGRGGGETIRRAEDLHRPVARAAGRRDRAADDPARRARGRRTAADRRAAPGSRPARRNDAGGRVQGLAMPLGKGRVVVMGEAGMFSARSRSASPASPTCGSACRCASSTISSSRSTRCTGCRA